MLLLLVEAGVLWTPLCAWCVCSVSAWTFVGMEQSALGCGQVRMDKHADGCWLSKPEAMIRARLGGRLCNGRADTVINLPK